ncbi:MAG: hypothetical protein P4M05_05215 [Bradyrhizobium sp.]|nr:hypothetical protein [Bradyrhizobium sp.]
MTESVDAAAADAWSKFTVGEAEKLVLHEAALKVLKVFPDRMPSQCEIRAVCSGAVLKQIGDRNIL